jgi:hypothetical protein
MAKKEAGFAPHFQPPGCRLKTRRLVNADQANGRSCTKPAIKAIYPAQKKIQRELLFRWRGISRTLGPYIFLPI